MSGALWIGLGIVVLLVALAAVAVALIKGADHGYAERVWPFVVGGIAVAVLCIPVAVKSFIAGGRSIAETSCASFADQTGYETKVIIVNAFDAGGCFVSLDGRWVPRGQLWAEMRDGAPS